MTKTRDPIRVLYVDDNPFDRELVARALAAEAGLFVLTEVASKKQLLACLREGEFDVVLSDFKILGFDGFDVVDLVREKRPGVPIIMVTGTGSEEIAVEAMRKGVSDYVIKSVKHIKRLPHTILAAVEKKRVEDSLRARSDELRALAAELSMAEERERRRLASDLHDTVGQSLALAQMKLGELESSAPSPQHAQALAEVRKIVRECLGVIRSLSFELSPPVLSELGLGPALEWLSQRFQEEHGLSVEVRSDRGWGTKRAPDVVLRQFLFRAARELLMNVVKHSGVTSAVVRLEKHGAKRVLAVEDSGGGLGAAALDRKTGFGLLHIRERIRHHGGDLRIEARHNGGARVTIELPSTESGVSSTSKPRRQRPRRA